MKLPLSIPDLFFLSSSLTNFQCSPNPTLAPNLVTKPEKILKALNQMNMVSYCACIWDLKTANGITKGAVFHFEFYHYTSHKVQNHYFSFMKKEIQSAVKWCWKNLEFCISTTANLTVKTMKP